MCIDIRIVKDSVSATGNCLFIRVINTPKCLSIDYWE